MNEGISPDARAALRTALQKRLAIIADTELRARDPAEQLAQLKAVAKEIDLLAPQFAGDARLAHYLKNASFEKALAHLGQQD
jgi:hypothetical protein